MRRLAIILLLVILPQTYAHTAGITPHLLDDNPPINWSVFEKNYFRDPGLSSSPLLTTMLSTFQFAAVPNVIPSRFIHSHGGNLNLRLMQQNGLDVQAGAGVVYFPIQLPNSQPSIFGNPLVHPNVDISIGYSF